MKSLTVTRGDGHKIREISFHTGLNLIVDETPITVGKETGNNVGKTTVLKLVDYCLGGNDKEIYIEPENPKNENKLVKDFLVQNEVYVSLVLKDDLSDEDSREIHIQRNFLPGKKKVQSIDGVNKTIESFEEGLTNILFPGHYGKKPSIRQIIAHNIRYSDLSINNTLKVLNKYTRDDEYETLYLFLLGCDFGSGDVKQRLTAQITVEENFKKRLESQQTKSAYETLLSLLESEIADLHHKKNSLQLNSNFAKDLDELNKVKFEINVIASEIGRLKLRQELILEAQLEAQSSKSTVDLRQLKQIYDQATSLVGGIQKTFEELHDFHNKMVESKVRFIAQDLPNIKSQLEEQYKKLNSVLAEESRLNTIVTQSDSFESLEALISDLNAKYYKKGEYENTLKQIQTTESKLDDLKDELSKIDDEIFSDEFASRVREQINKFNQHFSEVSEKLYGEKYLLKADPKTNNKGRKLYEFSAFNANFSSGKKQGEISCFDIAYTLFADEENIACLHFLLNDKKELMHGNQLLNIARLVNKKGIQFVTSILRDKLPSELNKDEYIVVKLSQYDKLFRIENPD